MLNIPSHAWIVVADGEKARMLRNVGAHGQLKLEQDRIIGPTDLIDDGPAGSQPPDSNDKQLDEATFAKQLAHRLNAGALKQEFAHLVLVADPHTLGQMRPLLHQETVRRLVGELPKTLTNSSLDDVQRSLEAMK